MHILCPINKILQAYMRENVQNIIALLTAVSSKRFLNRAKTIKNAVFKLTISAWLLVLTKPEAGRRRRGDREGVTPWSREK
jgi:hypothetical protein